MIVGRCHEIKERENERSQKISTHTYTTAGFKDSLTTSVSTYRDDITRFEDELSVRCAMERVQCPSLGSPERGEHFFCLQYVRFGTTPPVKCSARQPFPH